MKKKSILLLIFFAVILLSMIVIPNKVFATDELITEVRVTMNPIKVGNTISMTATLTAEPAAAVYKTNMPLNWAKSDNSDGSSDEIVTSGTFEADKYYWWDFDYGFNSGYYTDSTTKYYVNDAEYVYFSWVQPEKIKVTEIRLTGTAIKPGNEMPSTATIETVPAGGLDSATKDIAWFKSNNGTENDYPLDKSFIASGNFENNKYYWITTTSRPVTLKSGFEFASTYKVYYNDVEIESVSGTDITIKWVKAESPIIEELSITGVEEPVFGERAKQTTLPTVSLTPNIENETEGGWFKAETSFDKNHTLTLEYIKDNAKRVKITSNIDKNPIYEEGIYILALGTETEDDFILSENFKSTINGKNVPYEVNDNHLIYQYYIVELKDYSYKYILGDNQTLAKGKVSNYSFSIDGDDAQFLSFEVDGVAYVKDTDFTVTHGSTIITLLPAGIEKINSLAAGMHTTKVTYSNSHIVTGTFIISEEQVSNSTSQASASTQEVKDVTPKTGTISIIKYVIMMIISTGTGIVLLKKCAE